MVYIKKIEWIKDVYTKYLNSTEVDIQNNLFHLITILYSLETQHYFHIREKGKKFEPLLDKFGGMFEDIKTYVNTTEIKYEQSFVTLTYKGLIGEIDLIDKDDNLIEIKCTIDISLKHILQLLMYNIMYKMIANDDVVVLNF